MYLFFLLYVQLNWITITYPDIILTLSYLFIYLNGLRMPTRKYWKRTFLKVLFFLKKLGFFAALKINQKKKKKRRIKSKLNLNCSTWNVII